MRRERHAPRPGWRRLIADDGLDYDLPGRDGSGPLRPFWDESAHYVFEPDEVRALAADVELLHTMCLDAVENAITTERLADFGLPEWVRPAIAESWKRSDPQIYGRFDLRYDGSGPAKLLAYDADSPAYLLEAARVQRTWQAAAFPGDGQWNALPEKLVARWRDLAAKLAGDEFHFTCSGAEPTGVDRVTMTYLQETAADAGLDTTGLAIEDIGWDDVLNRFVDLAEAPMTTVCKLYPWAWMLEDQFGRQAIRRLPGTLWIEPLWKTLLANKALLAVLWEMNPGHPNLLPCYLDQPGMLTEYVRKPKLGRDGGNIQIVAPGYETETGGVYGKEGYVYQLFDPLPEYDGYRPVLGAWLVGDEAAGLGIRESTGLVTDDSASFVPHRVANS